MQLESEICDLKTKGARQCYRPAHPVSLIRAEVSKRISVPAQGR